MNFKKIFLSLSIVLLAFSTKAQDIHFSQMEFSPLTLNPALAGVNNDMQGIVNYRNQWRALGDPFSTIAASFEKKFKQEKNNRKGFLGVGVNFFNDRAGAPSMSSTNAALNVSYHVFFDDRNTFGAGLYTGFGQRSFSPADGKWGNQFDGANFDPTLGSGENFATERFAFFDIGGGVLYTFTKDDRIRSMRDHVKITAGGAFYHGNRPNYSFINRADENLPMRYSVFANAEIGLENSNLNFMPGVYYQLQGTAQELLFGSYVGYYLNDDVESVTNIAMGVFYRNSDAVVIKSYLQWENYTFGLAYDINISSLTEVSRNRGGVEFFLRYAINNAGASKSRI